MKPAPHPSHASDVSKLPRVTVHTIDGEPRSATQDDYSASVWTKPESVNSDFATIETVTDLGLGRHVTQQVRKYSLPGNQSLLAQGDETFRSDEAHLVGAHFSSEDVPARASEATFNKGLDADLQAEYSAHEVQDRLFEALQDPKHGHPDDRFLTHDDLFGILSNLAINNILEEAFNDGGNGHRLNQICGPGHEISRRMILATLIMNDHFNGKGLEFDQIRFIDAFIKHHIYDKDLPLSHDKARGASFFRTRDTGGNKFKAMRFDWSIRELNNFIDAQYRVITPYMNVSNEKVCFYRMDIKIRLPFAEWDFIQHGGHGSVYRARIHHAHHEYRTSNSTEPVFAVKSVFTKDFERYAREVRVLQHFSGTSTGHPHLIRLLMAFTHGPDQYLLFPWASGNLIDLWRQDPVPQRSTAKVHWLIDQCSGLAGGLAKLHHNNSWDHDQDGRQFQLGRHGDIKPHNILWFESFDGPTEVHKDHLVVSDFGLSIFHSSANNTELTTANNVGRSPTYRPPEVDLGNGPIQQSYDIWSLACLYLEFISWYLLGFEKTRDRTGGTVPDTFVDYRISGDNAHEDKFFTIRQEALERASYGAVVKPEVKMVSP
ncbi:uncharacterized protein PG986_010112 [Apiospora aurea]|uniref:Protein kinase domain-containing protein n=1 Tax=Apiospora aurea TaxID=335848 RepID=A0ABR1QAU8_9PEZI